MNGKYNKKTMAMVDRWQRHGENDGSDKWMKKTTARMERWPVDVEDERVAKTMDGEDGEDRREVFAT